MLIAIRTHRQYALLYNTISYISAETGRPINSSKTHSAITTIMKIKIHKVLYDYLLTNHSAERPDLAK